MISPTSRSKEYCKKKGWECAVVEKWNMFAKVRQDLFGIVDLMVLKEGKMLGVQATSYPNHNARVSKVMASPFLKAWLQTNAALEVWSFDSKKLKTKKGRRFKRTEIAFDPMACQSDKIFTQDFEELI